MRRFGPIVLLVLFFIAWQPLGAAAGEGAGQALKGLSLTEALQVLQARGLKIIFTSEVVRPGMRVAVEPRGTWPREILDEILAPHGLRARAGPHGTLLIVEAPRSGAIRGKISNGRSAKPIAGVRILVVGEDRETRSDRKGAFEFAALRVGTYSLKADGPGFFPGTLPEVEVREGRTTEVEFALTPAEIPAEEVIVTPNGTAARGRRPEDGEYIARGDLLRSPEIGSDVLRGLGRLPGVARSDLSAQMNVRGGVDDETMVILDGLEIYEPFHLQDRQGLLSSIDARAIGGLQYYGGAFPAEYGGRMSGVLDMDSVAPEGPIRNGVTASSDLYGFASQGRFRDGAGRWFVSGRKGDPSRLLDALGADPDYNPQYYDLFGSAAVDLSPGTRLSFHFLNSFDEVEGPEMGPVARDVFLSRYDSNHFWLRLQSAWRPRWLSETLLSVGELDQSRFGTGALVASVQDRRATDIVGFKQAFAFEAKRNFLRWGVEARSLRADYRYSAEPVGSEVRDITSRPAGKEFGVYVSDRIDLTPSLSVDFGLRWDKETYTPFEDDTVSPRINLAYALTPRTTLRAGWGIFHQPQKIHELQVEDGVEEFFPVQRAGHFTVGFEHGFRSGLELSASAYRKEMTGLRPRYENLFDPFEFFPEAYPDRVRIDPDEGRGQGVELVLRGPAGSKVSWWGGYTLASVEDRIGGEWVPRSWDQRHALDLGINYRPAEKWSLTVAGAYHSGRPTTPVDVDTRSLPDGSVEIVPVIGPRNSDRLPSFQSVDLRVDRVFFLGGTDVHLFLNVTNVFGHKNVCCVDSFDYFLQPDGGVGVDRRDIYGLPRLISFGATWSF